MRSNDYLAPFTGNARLAAALLIAAHCTLLMALGLFRHWGFMTSIYDLGVYDQAVWGWTAGSGFLNTIHFSTPVDFLGIHFSPILLLFVPLYALLPAAEWLVLAQAFALSIAAWPIFLLASRAFDSDWIGWRWAAIYLVNPLLLSAAAWDFHAVSLAVPMIAAGFLAIDRQRGRWLALCCGLLLLVQEQLGLAVLGFGALWGWKTGRWRLASALIALGLAHFFLVLGIVMPSLSHTGGQLMMSEGSELLGRYHWLGHSVQEVVGNVLLHPWTVLNVALLEMGGALYVLLLLLPFLGLPALAPAFLLPAMGDLAANLLSASPMPRWIGAYHSVTLVPILAVSAIHGATRLAPFLKRFTDLSLSAFILVLSLVLAYAFLPAPLPGAYNAWNATTFIQYPEPQLGRVHAAIRDEGAISVQGNVGAHFSQHQRIYLYPNKVRETDAIVLRLESPTGNLSPADSTEIGTLAHHLQMTPADYLASIACLLTAGEYGVVLWQDPWLVLSRGTTHRVDVQMLGPTLDRLAREWHVSAEYLRPAPQHCAGGA